LLVIDSIQTRHSDLIEGAPGTVNQVRASAGELIRYTKESGAALVLAGHVTKDARSLAARARAYGRRGAELRRCRVSRRSGSWSIICRGGELCLDPRRKPGPSLYGLCRWTPASAGEQEALARHCLHFAA
jgi:hypothetical protein